MKKFPEFLRYYLSITRTRVRQERLFKEVRESVKNGQQAFALLDQLENYSSLYIALGNSNDEFWRDTEDNRLFIYELELFRVKQAYPTLFIAYEKFSPHDFTRLLKLVCVLSFRYTVVSGLNPNELEIIYNKIALLISKSETVNLKQVFDQLLSVYVSDEKFTQDFSMLSISTKGQKKKLVRYILCKLEADISHIEINKDSFSIEHILPESPNSEWQQNFSERQAEQMTYRIGNLTLLEPHLNCQIGNAFYLIKQQIYQQSVYQLTQNILAEEWTPDTLTSRQRYLAQRAAHIWKSDFCE
jgi:hypothetical protein